MLFFYCLQPLYPDLEEDYTNAVDKINNRFSHMPGVYSKPKVKNKRLEQVYNTIHHVPGQGPNPMQAEMMKLRRRMQSTSNDRTRSSHSFDTNNLPDNPSSPNENRSPTSPTGQKTKHMFFKNKRVLQRQSSDPATARAYRGQVRFKDIEGQEGTAEHEPLV